MIDLTNKCVLVNFNSQPHEEADGIFQVCQTWFSYFNSQPHEEADHLLPVYLLREVISTHSLMKRLTGEEPEKTVRLPGFQLTAS